MRDGTRARVAATVAAATLKKSVGSVYDYDASTHRIMSVDIRNGQVNGFDHGTSTHFSGGGGGSLDFFDYEHSQHVQLALNGTSFSGFDYHTGQHFSGNVNGSSVTIFDHETGSHHSYSV